MLTRMFVMAGVALATVGLLVTVMGQEATTHEKKGETTEKKVPEANDKSIAVAGRVVDPQGNPVLGARLYVVGGSPSQAVGVRGVTDAQGKFEFEMRRHEFGLNDSGIPWKFSKIMAIADGHGPDFRPAYCFDPSGQLARELAIPQFFGGDQWDRTLKLVTDDVPVAGKIVDPLGQPVAGATVSVGGIWIPKAEDLTPWLKAIEEGEDYDIVVLKMMDRDVYPGKVMGAAITKGDGTFRLAAGIGRERLVSIQIAGPGIVSERIFVRTRPGPMLSVPHLVESPGAGTFRFFGSTFEFAARPSIPIVGCVRDKATSKPVAGVSIRFEADRGDQALLMEFDSSAVRTVSDEEGEYRLTGAPMGKNHTILAIPSGQPYLPAARQINLANEQRNASVDFALAKGIKIEGRITDAETGESVLAQVTYFAPTDNPLASTAPNLTGATIPPWQEPFVTNGKGEYTNVGFPGRGWIAVLAEDHRKYPRGSGPMETRAKYADWPRVMLQAYPYYCMPQSYHYVAEVEIPSEAASYRHDIVLTSKKRLEGTVADPEGKPLTGTTFGGLTETDGPYFFLATNRFCVNDFQSGQPRQLLFVHLDRKLAGSRLLDGPQNGPLTVQLEPWGTISGRIVNSDGKPRAKALIRGFAPGHGNRPGYGELPERHYWTDEQGHFRIEGLAPGLKYELEVIDNEKIVATKAKDLVLKAGETRELGDVMIQPN